MDKIGVAFSVDQIVAGLRTGSLSSVGVVKQCLRRYAMLEPWLHAFSWLDAERAIRAATTADSHSISDSLPLKGIPIGVKDIFDTAGIPTEHGSKVFEGRIPETNADAVDAMEKAGAILFGKTVTAELAYLHPGPTVNPWSRRRTPGGSSMGSAAAVAAGIVPLSIGTQTNGSVIRPAAFCGVVGFKPSAGTIPRRGTLVFSPTLDQVGVFARTVADATLLTSILAGVDFNSEKRDAGQVPRFYVLPRSTLSSADSPMLARFDSDVAHLRDQGAHVEFAASSPAGFDHALEAHRTIMSTEAYWSFNQLLSGRLDLVSLTFKALLEEGSRTTTLVYQGALTLRRKLLQAFVAQMQAFDALLTIPTPGEAPNLETTGDPRFCTPWTLIGAPAITLPTGLSLNRLPLGLQLVGSVGRDAQLVRAAEWVATRLAQLPTLALVGGL